MINKVKQYEHLNKSVPTSSSEEDISSIPEIVDVVIDQLTQIYT